MAKLVSPGLLVLEVLALIVCSMFFVGAHARVLHYHKDSINSSHLLHELGFHQVLKFQEQHPVWISESGSDIITPGGPYPQHHSRPPTRR